MFYIETYQDPFAFFENLTFRENEMHITGVTSLSVYMKKLAKIQNVDVYIETFDNLQSALYPMWNSPLTEVFLTSKVKAYLANEEQYSKTLIDSMKRSTKEIVDSFRFAAAFGIDSLVKTNNLSIEFELFRKIYEHLIQDPSVRELVREVNVFDRSKLNQLSRKPITTIYVYQLTNMNALRMYFFHKCISEGLRVVFRIPYYSQFPNLSSGWKTLYETVLNRMLVPNEDIRSNPVSIHKGNAFVEYVEGKKIISEMDNLAIKGIVFESPIHFLQYLKTHEPQKGGLRYIAFSYKKMNQILKDEHQEKVEHSIFSYPFGKFLFYMYEIKKVDGKIFLDYDIFIECITSGWVETRGINGKKALSFLKDLEPYMDGVQTITEIQQRFEYLDDLIDASRVFDQLAKDQTDRSRVKRYLTNPLRVFPYVHNDRYTVTIKILKELAQDLENKLKKLLPESDQMIRVNDHLEMIRQLWKRVKEFENVPDNIRKKLDHALQFKAPDSWMAEAEELREILSILLGKNKGKDEEQKIHGFDQLEGLMLNSTSLHLTDLSLKSLTHFISQKNSLPHFLNHTWLKESLQRDVSEIRYKRMLHSLHVDYKMNDLIENFFRFILFHTLSFFPGEITISWIKGINDHDDASIYFKILEHQYLRKNQSKAMRLKEDNWIIEELTLPSSSFTKLEFNQNQLKGQIPGVSWLDLDICPQKFFLSNITQPHPIYESDFHQRMVFATLGKLFRQQTQGKEDVKRYFYPLFPQWSNTLKDNLILTTYYQDLREYRSFQNVTYPMAMDSIQLLRSKYKSKKIKKDYRQDQIQDEKWINAFRKKVTASSIETEPGNYCMMCPHQLICTKGEYVVDGSRGAY